jgi:hypothetical protein
MVSRVSEKSCRKRDIGGNMDKKEKTLMILQGT